MDSKVLLNRVYNNIDYLILIDNVERGEVEKAIGVSAGYLTRSKEKGVDLPISKIVALAMFFRIHVDFLIGHNYEIDYLDRQIEKAKSRLDEIEKEDEQYIEAIKKG